MSFPNPKVLLVASKTGYQVREFARHAERLGYRVQLATDRCHVLDDPWADGAIPIRFEEPWTAPAQVAGMSFDGVIAVGDKPAYVAALIAEYLKLPFHSAEAVRASRNKFEMRRRFAEAGLLAPAYRRVSLDVDPQSAAEETDYPCVLKPLGLSASRGVIRADTSDEFIRAFERIRALLASPEILRMHEDQDRFLLVEQFIPGKEFAIEGVVTAGELTVLAIFDKPDPLDGPFFEESVYVTPSREPAAVQRAIVDCTRRAVVALGLLNGPIHAEMRVNTSGVWMLEIAGRPIGGLCAACLKYAGGQSLEDVLLRHAVGELPANLKLADPARGVMMIPIPRAGVYSGVSGTEGARSLPGIEDVIITAKEGQKLVPLPEGASYLGFIFSRGENVDAAEAALRAAHAELSFSITGELPVLSAG